MSIWSQLGNIITETSDKSDGHWVALSDNGLTLVVGGPQTKVSNFIGCGVARVYTFAIDANDVGVWSQKGNTILGGGLNTKFGSAVAISGNESTIVISSPAYLGYVNVYENRAVVPADIAHAQELVTALPADIAPATVKADLAAKLALLIL